MQHYPDARLRGAIGILEPASRSEQQKKKAKASLLQYRCTFENGPELNAFSTTDLLLRVTWLQETL
jgi:AMMECR1 domain-containing protein